jgi:siroheme synthase (precorrin-2 oxidase/ferrochelatase)
MESPARRAGLLFSAGASPTVVIPSLLRHPQLGEVGANGIERGGDLVGRGQQVELGRIAGAILQQR